MDFRNMCRICLESKKVSFDIFNAIYYSNVEISYSDMLRDCTKLKPYRDDHLPKNICKDCSKQLKKIYSFNILCDESDKKLREYLENVKEDQSTADGIDFTFHVGSAVNKCELDLKHEVDNINGDNNVHGQIVLEMLNQNIDSMDKGDIKIEQNSLDGDDSCWEADDNIMLGDIKTKEHETENDEDKPKKKRGRKKKVYLDGETRPLPKSRSPNQCDICGKVFSTKGNLNAHKICHTDIRPYRCTECPAAFKGHGALAQHRRRHTGETPYHCEYCPKRFSRRNGLTNHIKIHTGEKHFSCEICFKTFIQSAQLSTHMKRHKGEKAYLCQDCGKGFSIKADLRVHERIHNGEKPYSCHLCTKTFATAGNLSIHVRIHKKEIRYNCKECHRGFVTHSSYNVHIKRHKGQRDYNCECGKSFYTSSALKQHKVVHTGEKKYQCKICERKFTQTSHLNRHFKRDHAKANVPVPPSEHYKLIIEDKVQKFGLFDCCLDKMDAGGVKCEGS